MTKIFAALFASLLLLSCNNSGTKKHSPVKASLNSELTALSRHGGLNGFAVSIVHQQGTLYQKGFGYADVQSKTRYTDSTIQNIASISKTLVGVALLKARELGKLQLDDPISKYLPFKVVNPNFPQSPITIRQLATHTSGILDNEFYLTKDYYLKPHQQLNDIPLVFEKVLVFNPYDSIVPLEIFLKNILTENGPWHTKNTFANRKPGALYEYSNTGATLAGYILELATGQSLSQFTNTYILKPLNMNASGWKFDDVDFSRYSTLYENPTTALPFYSMISYPDGNFITSVNDLSLFLAELIKGYEGKGTVLHKESYAELFRPQLTAANFTDRDDKEPYSESFNVGIFMGFGYTGYIGHTGGDPGVTSYMFFNPATKSGRILITNTSFSDKDTASNNEFNAIWNTLEKYQAITGDK